MKTLIFAIVSMVTFSNSTYAQNDKVLIDTIMSALKTTGTLYRLADQNTESTLKTDASYSNNICSLKIEIRYYYKVVKASFSVREKNLERCNQQITNYILEKFANV